MSNVCVCAIPFQIGAPGQITCDQQGRPESGYKILSLSYTHTHVHTQTLISVFDAAGDFYCVCQNQKMRTKSPELTESMENTLDSRLYVHTAAICAHVNVKLIV